MNFCLLLTYTDVTDFEVPGVIKQEADTLRAAIEKVAANHGWRITDWNEGFVWYQKDGKDFKYSVDIRSEESR